MGLVGRKTEEQKPGTDNAERADPCEAGGVDASLPSFLCAAKTTAATQHLTAGAAAQISLTQSTPEGFYQVLSPPKRWLSTRLS